MTAASRKSAARPAPAWVFRWRRLGSPLFPKLLALGITCALFAAAASFLKIRIDFHAPWMPEAASVIHAGVDPAGSVLATVAVENGPYPSRFDLADWQGFQALEKSAEYHPASRFSRYVPQFRELPESRIFPAVPLAESGRPVLPPLPAPPPQKPVGSVVTVPVLYPLSGISASGLPSKLPALGFPVDGELAAGTWRFLIRLRPDGTVLDAVSLAGGDEDGSDRTLRLISWLRTIRFPAAPAETAVRTAGVALGFINEPEYGDYPR